MKQDDQLVIETPKRYGYGVLRRRPIGSDDDTPWRNVWQGWVDSGTITVKRPRKNWEYNLWGWWTDDPPKNRQKLVHDKSTVEHGPESRAIVNDQGGTDA